MQPVDIKPEKKGRKRRLSELLPETRAHIVPYFRRGIPVERIADDFEVAPLQILEHVVRDAVGAKHPGSGLARKPPASEQRPSAREALLLIRRSA